MEPALPNLPSTKKILTEALARGLAPREHALVVVQHLREDTACFLRVLEELGFRVEKVLGIAYSSKSKIATMLRKDGFSVSVPHIDDLERELLTVSVDLAKRERKFIIHDVGGYFARAMDSLPPLLGRWCSGIVEDTKQGLWQYRMTSNLDVPILHIATSQLKQIEHRYVGKGVVDAIDRLVSPMGRPVSGQRAGILGFGSVGAAVADEFCTRGVEVCCYDRDPIKMTQLRRSAVRGIDKRTLIEESELIVGATGLHSMDLQDIECLRDGAVLASASSKRLEFPIREIDEAACERKAISPLVTEFRMPWKKRVLLLSHGFPVNLTDEAYSLPEDVSDLMFAQVAACIVRIMSTSAAHRVHSLSLEQQRRIAALWLGCHREMNVSGTVSGGTGDRYP